MASAFRETWSAGLPKRFGPLRDQTTAAGDVLPARPAEQVFQRPGAIEQRPCAHLVCSPSLIRTDGAESLRTRFAAYHAWYLDGIGPAIYQPAGAPPKRNTVITRLASPEQRSEGAAKIYAVLARVPSDEARWSRSKFERTAGLRYIWCNDDRDGAQGRLRQLRA